MPNHVHLLAETPRPNVSAGMRWLHGRYADHVNHRHGHKGHVFDRRFHSIVVERDSQLLELVRYMALNPVRARICAEPEWFPWSAYRELVALAPATCTSHERVLGYFAPDLELARERLSHFVLDAPVGR